MKEISEVDARGSDWKSLLSSCAPGDVISKIDDQQVGGLVKNKEEI